MKNKKCISLTLAALLDADRMRSKGKRQLRQTADNRQVRKYLPFGCQMYTDGIVNTV